MEANIGSVSDRVACGGVFADIERILKSGNEVYIDCLKKSIAAYISGIEIDERQTETLRDLNERCDRLEKIMKTEEKEMQEIEQRKARAKAKPANSLSSEFRIFLKKKGR